MFSTSFMSHPSSLAFEGFCARNALPFLRTFSIIPLPCFVSFIRYIDTLPLLFDKFSDWRCCRLRSWRGSRLTGWILLPRHVIFVSLVTLSEEPDEVLGELVNEPRKQQSQTLTLTASLYSLLASSRAFLLSFSISLILVFSSFS
jgi:hypothetical protein